MSRHVPCSIPAFLLLLMTIPGSIPVVPSFAVEGNPSGRSGSRPEIVLQIGHVNEPTEIVFSPDGQRIASASKDHTVKLWDAQTGRLLQNLTGHQAPVLAVAFSPNGQNVIS